MEETLAEFRRFDLTGCGSMARDILAGVLQECTELSGEAIDALIDMVDTEGTGRIKYEQFVFWLFGKEEAPAKHRPARASGGPRAAAASAPSRPAARRGGGGVAARGPAPPARAGPRTAPWAAPRAAGPERREWPPIAAGPGRAAGPKDPPKEAAAAERAAPRPAETPCEGAGRGGGAPELRGSSDGACEEASLEEPVAGGLVGVYRPDPESGARKASEEEPQLGATGSTCSPDLDRSRSSASREPMMGATSSMCSLDLSSPSSSSTSGAGAGASAVSRTPVAHGHGAAATATGGGAQAEPPAQICRYCLDTGDVSDLVSPCACRGSSSFVHVQCLLCYAKQQQQDHTGIDVTCPTCKTPYMGTAALRLLPLALEDVQRRHGAKHVAVARVLKTMAGNHLSLMQFEEAKNCIEAAAEMHRSLQDAPFDVAGEPIDMAEVLAIRIMIDQGMCAILQDAKWDTGVCSETVAQVVSLLDEHYKHECGPDAPRVAGVLMSLCLGDSERPVRQRIKMLQRALGLLEGYYGKDRADEYANTLNVLTTMAILAGEVGDFQTVKSLSERAIVVQRRHSGPAHPTTLMSCCLLVCAQLKLGEIGEARVLLDQVIRTAEQTEFMPALAPAMRVVRARLLGELGDVEEMRCECLRIIEEANSRSDMYTKLKGPEPACTLREAEAVLGRVEDVAGLFAETPERSADSPGSDWEDRLRDLAVRAVLGEPEQAAMLARASARELQATLGVDALRVMSGSISYVRRFWAHNLKGAPKASLEAWFEALTEYAVALSYSRRLCTRSVACAVQRERPGSEGRRLAADLAQCGDEESVDYGATCTDAYVAGDRVRSLVNMAGLPNWALHEGDEGAVEAPGPLHGCASICFNEGTVVLPLTDICRPRDFEERMCGRGKPCRGFAPGQLVRSLVSAACHPRALARGLEGRITAVDRTRGRVNVDFGGANDNGTEGALRVTLLLSDVSPVEEFEAKLQSRREALGGFFVGESVRSLIFLPLQASRPLLFGAEGVVSMLDLQHRRVLVRFGGEEPLQVLLRFQDVCLMDEFEARLQERRGVLAGLMPGDRVRSLVSCQDWVPRPLRVGDEGTILMINPVTNRALVDFAGEETLRGEMDPSSVCPAREFEARILTGARGAGEPPQPS